jgi:hypothetical protein
MSENASAATLNQAVRASGLPDAASAAATVPRGSRRAADLTASIEHWPLLRVSLDRLDGPGYLVYLGGLRGEILLRQQDPMTRRRYTLAHELGHWYAKVELGRDDAAGCRDPVLERWCEQFAAHILMPVELMSADLDRISPASRETAVPGLARAYRVSWAAVRIRIAELSRDGQA